jgi:hypothetical protein
MAPGLSSLTLSGCSRILISLKKHVGWLPDGMLPQPEARAVTLLHGYANLLKKLDISESGNLHKCLILLDSYQIHATR